jgi:hypothetical protein
MRNLQFGGTNMDLMKENENKPVATYHEKTIGKTHYRVTSVYLGKFELARAIEDMTVRKILREDSTIGSGCVTA